MSRYKSLAYKKLEEAAYEQYHSPTWPQAKKWRNRVGLPRLVAEDAISEALWLLRGIDPRVFRADEADLKGDLLHIRVALDQLQTDAFRVSWQRYEGTR